MFSETRRQHVKVKIRIVKDKHAMLQSCQILEWWQIQKLRKLGAVPTVS